jgi:hypothetical protein
MQWTLEELRMIAVGGEGAWRTACDLRKGERKRAAVEEKQPRIRLRGGLEVRLKQRI